MEQNQRSVDKTAETQDSLYIDRNVRMFYNYSHNF